MNMDEFIYYLFSVLAKIRNNYLASLMIKLQINLTG